MTLKVLASDIYAILREIADLFKGKQTTTYVNLNMLICVHFYTKQGKIDSRVCFSLLFCYFFKI